MRPFYQGKTVLVTGGTGSIGLELVRRLLQYHTQEIRVFTNDEDSLFRASNSIQSTKVIYLLGDVREPHSIERAIKGCDIVFHAAALKHVDFCEINPYEAISTNIMGTQNMIEAAMSNYVRHFVFISTDKAVNPVSTMGATKLLGERLVASAAKRTSQTVFSAVRFGNVLGSRGSVVLIFEREIRLGKPITITDPQMTRFIMAPSDASKFVLKSAELAKSGEILVLKMKSVRIVDLAEACKEFFAKIYRKNPRDIMLKVIGAQPGEKIHEELMTYNEAIAARDLGDYIVLNPHPHREEPHLASGGKRMLASNLAPRASKREILTMLSELYDQDSVHRSMG
jgi:UDP-N-acetylglucosamine 4,6-dehydratase